jgi:hypothetical protein
MIAKNKDQVGTYALLQCVGHAVINPTNNAVIGMCWIIYQCSTYALLQSLRLNRPIKDRRSPTGFISPAARAGPTVLQPPAKLSANWARHSSLVYAAQPFINVINKGTSLADSGGILCQSLVSARSQHQ